MTQVVARLNGDLSVMAGVAKGQFASKYIQVMDEVDGELRRMNVALQATAAATSKTRNTFDSGDNEQAQTVGTIQTVGLTSGLRT